MPQPYFEEFVTIQPKGLITIPKKIRQELGFEERKPVRLRKEKGRLVIEPVTVLSYPVRRYTDKELKEFLALDSQETKKLKRKKLI